MPTHSERRTLPHSAEQLFTLVWDVARYPEFLPWVSAARVLTREPNEITAELVISFKGISERYTSRVICERPMGASKNNWAIYTDLVKGPFSHLENRWVFHDRGVQQCDVEFYLDFSLKAGFLQTMLSPFFDRAVHTMVSAFENRARELYG